MVICHLLAGGTCLPIQPISPFCLFNPYKHVINTKYLHTSAMKLNSFSNFLGKVIHHTQPSASQAPKTKCLDFKVNSQ